MVQEAVTIESVVELFEDEVDFLNVQFPWRGDEYGVRRLGQAPSAGNQPVSRQAV